ncbi:hypothetical protein RUM44_012485 [Polyplax serrata]|uniref:Uncharacterized protein n=1 Tax=Polyplax serrata TaxID=468196 RepID=A0ABR1BBF1_POLSC
MTDRLKFSFPLGQNVEFADEFPVVMDYGQNGKTFSRQNPSVLKKKANSSQKYIRNSFVNTDSGDLFKRGRWKSSRSVWEQFRLVKRQDAEYKLIGGGHLPGDLATSVNPDGQQTGQQKRFGTGCAEQKTFPIPTEVETRRQVTLSFRIMRQSYYQSLYHWWQKKANPITIW